MTIICIQCRRPMMQLMRSDTTPVVALCQCGNRAMPNSRRVNRPKLRVVSR